MKLRFLPLLVLIALISAGTLQAGQLSPDLKLKAKADPDTPVKVWIKLPPSAEAQSFRSPALSAATAAELHRNSIETLKRGHASAQADLVSHLEQMGKARQADRIKAHWLVNVIEAEIAASELESLAARDDIESIVAEPTIGLIRPTYESAASENAVLEDSVVDNLKHIKAREAWAALYTGAGRVICSFDTGIEGTHPALQASWRGRGGSRQDSLASWFDPIFHQLAPHTLPGSLSPQHGTHTMGIMVGRDTVKNITYGVAPDAKWISAGVIDIAGASIIDAFEWAADPDGDPNTISDLPDVINHSWGYREEWVDCENIVFDMVDATEALGIVSIFAAGNSGPSATTIYNPATRANDSIDCFAAGMINLATPPSVDLVSSRGPSSCNGSIKPNVVAPGVSIWSSIPGAKYGTMSGTSMAAPHVAGLVALIRQKNPAATVAEIKTAILNTTQRYTWTIPNNNQGWGEIDCIAALNAISTTQTSPRVRLYDFVHNTVLPGVTVTGQVVVQNIGTNVFGLTGSIVGSHPLLTILDGQVTFGTVVAGAVDTSDILSVIVSDTVSSGTVITVPFRITNGSYTTTTSLAFLVEPRVSKSIATHTTPRLQFSVSNFGVYGMGSPSLFPIGGQGFNFDGLGNDLWECGLMLTTGPTKLVSGVHDQLYEPEMDFKVAPGGDLQFDTLAGAIANQGWSRFTDANAATPIGVEITQQSYSFADPYDDLVLLRYVVKNISGGAISNLRVGLHLDWDIWAYSRNAGGWEADDQFLWMAYNSTNAADPVLTRFRGARLVEGPLATAATTQGRIAWVGWEPGLNNGLLSSEKYQLMVSGIANPDVYKDSLTDLLQTLAAGPLTLSVGQADTLVFAIFGGSDMIGISGAAAKSVLAYNLIGGQAPTAATLILPEQNAIVSNLLPTFGWSAANDPNPGDVVTYTLRYGTDPTLATATSIASLTDTVHTLTDSLVNNAGYYWQVIATDNTGMYSTSAIRHFTTDISTDVPDNGNGLPRSFALHQNYPNPFNPTTIIAFDLPRAAEYTLTIFDISGREVHQRSGSARAGRIELEWNASGQGSGVYLYRLTAGEFVSSRKMLLLK